jgi:hypothetical protein
VRCASLFRQEEAARVELVVRALQAAMKRIAAAFGGGLDHTRRIAVFAGGTLV